MSALGRREHWYRDFRTTNTALDWFGPRWRWERWERRLRLFSLFYVVPWRREIRYVCIELWPWVDEHFIAGAAWIDSGGDVHGLFVGFGPCLRVRFGDTDHFARPKRASGSG